MNNLLTINMKLYNSNKKLWNTLFNNITITSSSHLKVLMVQFSITRKKNDTKIINSCFFSIFNFSKLQSKTKIFTQIDYWLTSASVFISTDSCLGSLLLTTTAPASPASSPAMMISALSSAGFVSPSLLPGLLSAASTRSTPS